MSRKIHSYGVYINVTGHEDYFGSYTTEAEAVSAAEDHLHGYDEESRSRRYRVVPFYATIED